MSMRPMLVGIVVAGLAVLAGASHGSTQTCATLTTTVTGQSPVQEVLQFVAGPPVAGAPMAEVIGTVVATGETFRGPAALLPDGATARVGLTINDADPTRIRFVGLAVELAMANGTGVFARADGATGTAVMQVGPCP
jgi:hypothetical protein